MQHINRENFGNDFHWGVSTAAYQIEGAHNLDGKAPSIWDRFTHQKGKIHQNQNADIACDFYHRYTADIDLMHSLHIPSFRFSIAWSRVLPKGIGKINAKGIDFYDRVIDYCLEKGIEPWVTLYHWDLPEALYYKGGWTNRLILQWFEEFATVCAQQFGDRVNYWMVLNEPMVFTGAGYFLGVHAPGEKGLTPFLKAVHHATLAQGVGGRVLRALCPTAQIGTTYSCSWIEPRKPTTRHIEAAQRVDAVLNRLFVEPVLGMGYPVKRFQFLQRLEEVMRPSDEVMMPFDFDFIGIQNYTREVVEHSWFTPYVFAKLVPPEKREVSQTTLMNWEVWPQSIYHILKQFGSYHNAPAIVVTENGAAFPDKVQHGKIHDHQRKSFIQECIRHTYRAKQEGTNISGYFIWTFMDNFEWAEGYIPRFGIVHTNFDTQERTVKDSGYWYRDFLKGEATL